MQQTSLPSAADPGTAQGMAELHGFRLATPTTHPGQLPAPFT